MFDSVWRLVSLILMAHGEEMMPWWLEEHLPALSFKTVSSGRPDPKHCTFHQDKRLVSTPDWSGLNMIPSDSELMVWFVLSHHSWMCLKLLNAIREMEFPSSSWQEKSTAPAARATGPPKDLIYWYCTHNPLPDELPWNSSKLLFVKESTISCDSFTINTDLTDCLVSGGACSDSWELWEDP